MDLKQFIEENDVLVSNSLISPSKIKNIENLIKVKIGEQLRTYITTYGYLIFEGIELYGITARQHLGDSDLVKQTLYLHKYFTSTKGYIALENQGDGDYYLVDSQDNIWELISEQNKLKSTGLKLFDYILKRFEEAL